MPVKFNDAIRQVCPIGFWRNLLVLDEMVSGDTLEWEQVVDEYGKKYPVISFLLGVTEKARERETEEDEGEVDEDTEGLAFSALVHCVAMIWTSEGRCGDEEGEDECEFQCREEDLEDGDEDWLGKINLN